MRVALIILLLVALGALYWASGRESGHSQELKRQEARHLVALDSLEGEIIALRAKEGVLMAKLEIGRDSLKTALKRASNQKIRYVEIKPLILPSNAQLDSALTALYPRFTPSLRGS